MMTARHICKICEKSFQLKYQLTVHEKVHEDESKSVTVQIKPCLAPSEPPPATTEGLEDKIHVDDNVSQNDPQVPPEIVKKSGNIKKMDKDIVDVPQSQNQNEDIASSTLPSSTAIEISSSQQPRRTSRVPKKRIIMDAEEDIMINYVKLISKLDSRVPPPSPPPSKNLDHQDPPLSSVEVNDEPAEEEEEAENQKEELWDLWEDDDVKTKSENDDESTRVTPTSRQRKNKKGPQKCPVCSKIFGSRSSLLGHLRVHTGEKPFSCPTCQKSFAQRGVLTRHQQVHNETKDFVCEICTKAFNGMHNLQKHYIVHTNERPYDCPICSKLFKSKSQLTVHMQTHSKNGSFHCSVCGKDFCHKFLLNKHMARHSDKKPYNCAHCQKSFKTNKDRMTHTRTHTGERPFKCPTCPASFAQLGALNRHKMTHLEKSIECQKCPKKFSTKNALHVHLKIHIDQKPHSCQHRFRTYLSSSSLKKHEKRHHTRKELTCKFPKCDKKFWDSFSLQRHECSHEQGGGKKRMKLKKGQESHGCKICKKNFVNQDFLQRHYLTHDEKDVKCHHCNKYFATAVQLMKHQERQGCGAY